MIAEWVLKMWIIISKKHFVIFLDNCTHKGIKATTNQIVRLQPDEMKSKKSQTRLMSWCLKRKPTWRNDLITYNSHPWIMFFLKLIDYHSERGGIVWNWPSKVKGVKEFWTLMDKGGGKGSRKLDNFNGRHMCIIPNGSYSM